MHSLRVAAAHHACHLPVFDKRMKRFLQFRLGCHSLPIATGGVTGTVHDDRALRVCLSSVNAQ